MKKLIYLFFLFLLFTNKLKAQENYFTQYFTSSTFLNPSLSGVDLKPRATLLYRNHWPQIENSFITQALVFETNFERTNHGIGLTFYNDKAGDGNLSTNSVGISYAHEINLSSKWFLRSGIHTAYAIKSVDWDKLVFEDMIDSREGVVYTSQQPRGHNLNFWDISVGASLFSKKHLFGFSVKHLNQADEGLVKETGEASLSPSFTFHGSTKIQGNSKHQSISPALIYRYQNFVNRLQVGVLAELNSLQFGAWYGSEERLILSSGLQLSHFGFTYAYDIYSSKILNRHLGSHELSIRYTFEKNRQRRNNYRRQVCPQF